MRRVLPFAVLALLALPALDSGGVAPGPVAAMAGVVGLAAQDVEMLGEHYGTRPPDAYFQELERDPGAFQFRLEGRERLLHMQQMRGAGFPDLILHYGDPARSLGPRDIPMVGTFRFPLVLGLFADSPEPAFDRDRIQEEYFDGPNSYHQTVTELYDEMSSGRVQLEGTTFPWIQVELTRSQVTLNNAGLSSSREEGVGAYVEQIVRALDEQGVDWSRFDNTGDGFVDVLSVIHPTHGAECDGGANQIWSHRWNLQSATQGRLAPDPQEGRFEPGVRTSTPRPDGLGYIYVNDYTIQPVLNCRAEDINEIGVFAHELGHGFGLPDLYGTYGASARGAGRWDLMGTGAWGCRGGDPSRPCHMGAWSKAVLGWVDVIELDLETDHGTITLPPVQTSHEVLRIPAEDGSPEFLLLENRQRIGSDQNLWEPGLLIWHVDSDVLESRWPTNRVNNDQNRLGVWLRQADGRNELAGGGPSHGDPGDPFPGCIKDSYWDYFDSSKPCLRSNTRFHAGSQPASRTHGGDPFGVTLTEIQVLGDEPHDVRFDLTTRRTRVTLSREGEVDPAGGAPYRVDGEPRSGEPLVVEAFPFDEIQVEAPPGEALEEGVRVGFQGWSDGEPRVRTLTFPLADTELTAAYGGRELRIEWVPSADDGPGTPGNLATDPHSSDLWFLEGTQVELEAEPRSGYSFVEWTGALAGRENPTTVTVDEPMTVEADFSFEFGVVGLDGEIPLPAAEPGQVDLRVNAAQQPVEWTLVEGELPAGLRLSTFAIPRLSGVPMEMGRFPITLRVRDATGLEAQATVILDVGRPAVGISELTGPFLGRDEALSSAQKEFLDVHGNNTGGYDVGDLRRYLRENPDLADGAAASSGLPAAPSPSSGVVIRDDSGAANWVIQLTVGRADDGDSAGEARSGNHQGTGGGR